MTVTENITVLFTDLVAPTDLARRLSPQAANDLRRRHLSILRQAIAEAGGTEVKNLGDGLMVVFASTSAALSCGVAMQQGVERGNHGAEHDLSLRVGLSGGEATREADDYFGDPVIEAARLCARAERGQILASQLVRATAGRRSPHPVIAAARSRFRASPNRWRHWQCSWNPSRALASALCPCRRVSGCSPKSGCLVGKPSWR